MKLKTTNYKGVFISDKGKYYINFKDADGTSKRRVTNAGSAKEAKRLLEEKKHEIADIKDGKISAVNMDRSVDTVDELADIFFELRDTKGNRADEARYVKWVKPVVGSVKHPISLMEMERLQRELKGSKVNGTLADGKPERDIAPATVNDIMTLLVGMLRWGVKRKLVLYVDGVPSPSPLVVDNERERVLSRSELDRLLDELDVRKALVHKRDIVRRNRLVVLLGYYTGSRPIHYLNLKGRDILVDDRAKLEDGSDNPSYMLPTYIMFSALKGAKAYSIPVHPELQRPLAMALMELDNGDERLFQAGSESIRKSVGLVLNRLFNEGICISDVKHRVTLYTLRHTSATNMLESSGDIYLSSKLLGHESVKTTQRYAKVTDKSLRAGIAGL